MKLILSRKGLDSSFGNIPSPILPGGRLCWLPIPENSPSKPGLPTYDEIRFDELNLGDLVEALSRGRLSRHQTVHLDPDINKTWRSLPGRWHAGFGQTGAAEKHLRNHDVKDGDLFLFFGWFRQTEWVDGRLAFVKGARDLHIIYGWLLVGERISVDMLAQWPEGLDQHPHLIGSPYGSLDAVYLPSKGLLPFGNSESRATSGLFRTIRRDLILTRDGGTRSEWRLPRDFHPDGRTPLSYHSDPTRWTSLNSETVDLRLVSRGQEFVLNLDDYPGVQTWLNSRVFVDNISIKGE